MQYAKAGKEGAVSFHVSELADGTPAIGLLVAGERAKELRTVLQRALNTWDNPPDWLVSLSSQLTGVPEIRTEPWPTIDKP